MSKVIVSSLFLAIAIYSTLFALSVISYHQKEYVADMQISDSEHYTGELVDSEPFGPGELRLDNGWIYKGQFIDGKLEGEGTITSDKGKVFAATFLDNEIISDVNVLDNKSHSLKLQ